MTKETEKRPKKGKSRAITAVFGVVLNLYYLYCYFRAERQIEKNKEIKKIVLDELEVTLNKAYEQSLEKTKEVEEMIVS